MDLDFDGEAFRSIASTVKAAGALASNDISFLRSSDPEFSASLDATNSKILDLAKKLMRNVSTGSDVRPPKLNDIDDVENQWNSIVEVADFLLEKADVSLDEYAGAIRPKQPEQAAKAPVQAAKLAKPRNLFSPWKSRNLPKPQLQFEVAPNNLSSEPFRPLLTTKPHATVPLDENLKTYKDEEGRLQYPHPYQREIMQMNYPEHMFQPQEPVLPLPFEETKAIWVDSPETLTAMLQDLKQAKEIAIDLEHHDLRSYVGFVCLMQISTRQKDWIIDTLKLRRELQILNKVFADPSIIKVFHGAYMDVVWLQRDFGLYLVGLFDTYHAARTLGFKGHGLAFLLKKYVDFDADKQYQLADWRMRPLPEEMFNYARSDTHFLLYCFDRLRNELLERSDGSHEKMQTVLSESKETALKRYETELYDSEDGLGNTGWRYMLQQTGPWHSTQVAVFRAVHAWRDRVARQDDESPHFVMPKHQMFNLARNMPTDIPSVLTTCATPSQSVRLRISELVSLIKTVKESAPVENVPTTSADVTVSNAVFTEVAHKNHRNVIDVFKTDAMGDDLLRSQTSTFWGDAVGSSRWLASKGELHRNSDVRLAIPLPQLTAAIFISTDDSKPSQRKPVDPGARPEHEYVKNRGGKREDDDIIIVKSLGGGRKRKIEESVTSGTHPGMPSNEGSGDKTEAIAFDHERTLTTVATNADVLGESEGQLPTPEGGEGKRRKKRKREAPKPIIEGGDNKELKPFDYANAPSVLYRADGGGKGKRSKKDRGFDPYSKSGDAPKGMGKEQREKAGRSFTFKK